MADILVKLHTDSLVLNYGTRVTLAKPADLVRILASWAHADQVELALRNMLLSAILSAEKRQVGAGLVCAHLLALGSRPVSKKDARSRNVLKYRADPRDTDAALRYFVGSGMIYELMKIIIEAGGLSATLNFDTTECNDFIVQAYSTKEVLGKIHPLFTSTANIDRLKRVTIMAVNGKIESLGEVDHLLQTLAHHKANAIFCARGFTPDVVATLDKNWLSGKLRVIPFIVDEWEVNQQKGINNKSRTLEICKELNIKCISAELGESFKEVRLDDFTVHDQIVFSKQGLSFEHEAGLSQYVEVRVPKRLTNMMGVISDRCQLAQKACMGVAKSGICDDNWLQPKGAAAYTIRVSHSAQIIGELAAISCYDVMKDLGGLVIGRN